LPSLARPVEALRAGESFRVHKQQFKDAVGDPSNTVHAAAEKRNSGKEKQKGCVVVAMETQEIATTQEKQMQRACTSFVVMTTRSIELNPQLQSVSGNTRIKQG